MQREPTSASAHEQAAKIHSEYTLNGHLGRGNDESAVAAASLRVKGNDTDRDGGGKQSKLSSGPQPLPWVHIYFLVLKLSSFIGFFSLLCPENHSWHVRGLTMSWVPIPFKEF